MIEFQPCVNTRHTQAQMARMLGCDERIMAWAIDTAHKCIAFVSQGQSPYILQTQVDEVLFPVLGKTALMISRIASSRLHIDASKPLRGPHLYTGFSEVEFRGW